MASQSSAPLPDPAAYLISLLNRSFRVTTTDTRMFLGEFKCTDSQRNIILSHAYEYRTPPSPSLSAKAPNIPQKIVQDMTSRYLGLIVVPGEYITKIELEEFASQIKGRSEGRAWNKEVTVENTYEDATTA